MYSFDPYYPSWRQTTGGQEKYLVTHFVRVNPHSTMIWHGTSQPGRDICCFKSSYNLVVVVVVVVVFCFVLFVIQPACYREQIPFSFDNFVTYHVFNIQGTFHLWQPYVPYILSPFRELF